MKYWNLEKIFNPKSVAIIGASQNQEKVGHIILQNYINVGFGGKIYPINVNADSEILGLKAYKSVLDVKANIDLVVIAIPAEKVNEVLEECGRAKIKGAVIVSSGFSEVGEVERQKELEEIANKYEIAVIGPNCLGIMDMYSRVDTMYLPTYKLDKPSIGNISFASQSGAVGSVVLDIISHEGFGLNKFVSYGNAAVVDETDILNFLMNDEKTKVITFYIEGVKRGKEFIELAKKTTKKKPVIILKGGKTEGGMAAAHSHTASLAGSNQAYDAVFKQFGFIEANGLDELIYFTKIFNSQPQTTGKRIAIITNGGGAGVLATDAVYKEGLELAKLDKKTEEILRKQMPPIVNIRLPMDIGGDADETRFKIALDNIANDKNVDGLIVISLFQTPGADSRVASMLIKYNNLIKKPMVVVSPGGNYAQVHNQMLESSGIPVYDSETAAVKSLAALIKYSNYVKGTQMIK